MSGTRYQQSYHGSVEQLNVVREFAAAAVRALGGSDDDVFACELCTDEAATNVFLHAYAGKHGRLDISIWRDGDVIALQFRDWGAPFDPARVPKPRIDAPLEERPIGGLGIFLIHHYMQDVAYTFDAVAGNTLTMRRRITS